MLLLPYIYTYIVHPESFRSNAQNAIAFACRNRPRVKHNDRACVRARIYIFTRMHLYPCFDLRHQLCDRLKRVMELASEKGASSWLTALPLTEHSFSLHKGAFRDALALRYGWLPLQTHAHCDCGANLSIDHSLSCPKGGFPSIRHNEDVRIFNPHASSNHSSHLSSTYRIHEMTKKRAYEQRIREVEHASFTPLIFSASGGMAREATTFYKRLASLLSTKREQPYSSTMMWLRCLLSFSLLCSAIQSIRGARSSKGHAIGNNSAPSDLINSEALLPGSY